MQIEEPFSILPLCHICGTIRRNVEELCRTAEECDSADGGRSAPSSAAALVARVAQQGGGEL